MVKALTEAELAILAAGRPASRPDEFWSSEKERSRYDRLIKRQRELAKAADPPRPPRRSSRLEQKKLLVSDEWLAKEHSTIGHVEAGTPIESPTHVRRRISAIFQELQVAASTSRPRWLCTRFLHQRRAPRRRSGASIAGVGEHAPHTRLSPACIPVSQCACTTQARGEDRRAARLRRPVRDCCQQLGAGQHPA